jgi:hypothetical protein
MPHHHDAVQLAVLHQFPHSLCDKETLFDNQVTVQRTAFLVEIDGVHVKDKFFCGCSVGGTGPLVVL